ncbi:hemerythrin domain-containing protein [Tessaracoccus coleopterorum]|uniref:hemerythrin domain-containing protein n=1 Tax=Tessaracoccus coleopterorum TaxID=2714950 RepID=UPI0018D4916A|nr:hemerythrin domain-containing protein [Tessaracoccus coleopterorum]
MAEIHRYYKAGFGEGAALVGGVAAGDAQHATAVATHLAGLSRSLHAHHEFEDANLWDELTGRAPGCALHVGRMKQQHATMLVHLNDLDASLPAWGVSGRAADARPVLAALAGINEALAVHLPDEEANIVPVMEEVLEQEHMEAAARHGRAPPQRRDVPDGGAIIAAQPDGGATWVRKNLPGPVRLVWRYYGRRQYERQRRVLLTGR